MVALLVVGTIVSAGGLAGGIIALGAAANGIASASLLTTVLAFGAVGAGTVFAASAIIAGGMAIESWASGGSFGAGLNSAMDYGETAMWSTIGGGAGGMLGGAMSWAEQRPDIKATHSWSTESKRYWKSQGYSSPPKGSDGKTMVLNHTYGRIGRGFYIYEPMTVTQHKAFHAMYGYGGPGGFYRTIPYTNFWELIRKALGG